MQGTIISTYHPSLKLVILMALVIASFILVFLFGVVLAMPFFGIDILDSLAIDSRALDDRSLNILKYFQIVNQIGVFIIPALAFSLLMDRSFFRYMKLSRSVDLRFFIAGGAVIFIILPFISWLIDVNALLTLPDGLSWLESWMRDREEEARLLTEALLGTETFGGFLLNLFMIALLAAVGEELIFRGVLVRIFGEWFRNHHLAVWTAALLFSAFHLQFYGFVPRFVLGVVLGYLFVWTRSLWVPIFVHFLNNAFAVTVGYLHNIDLISTDVESFGSTNNIVFIMGSLVFSIVIMFYVRWLGRQQIDGGPDPR